MTNLCLACGVYNAHPNGALCWSCIMTWLNRRAAAGGTGDG